MEEGATLKTTLEQLCRLHTSLSEEDIEILQGVASTLQLYADLAEAYFFIDCMMEDETHAIVVAESFPNIKNALYENSVVGKIVFESFEPGVFYSYRKGKKSIIRRAVTQEGRSVEQTVVPIKNADNHVIGVLIKEKETLEQERLTSSTSAHLFPAASVEKVMEDSKHHLPVVSDLLMEMFILTDEHDRLVYANPVGVKFIIEMSQTEDFYHQNVVALLPFLHPVYEQKDDVFVFDVSIDRKSLIVKKIRLRTKDKVKETLLIIQDLTELRAKEKELMMKSVVIQEIHHRVKNNLQTVASLLRLQMRNGVPEESRSSFEDTLNRIFSISSVYELILANENAEDDDVNIVELTRKICTTMVINNLFKKIDLIIRANGNKILTTSRKAVSIALIVNELVQNSLKHAFSDRDDGEITIDFMSNGDYLELHISDNGVGMKGSKSSLGMQIVQNLVVNDLNGEVLYVPEKKGTHAIITFPVSSEVVICYEEESFNR